MVIIIGRGHSGTRVISQVLYDNGFKTGKLNPSYDMIPPEDMYVAAKIFSEKVKTVGDYEWDFKVGEIQPGFVRLVKMYLGDLIHYKDKKYFKLPETTLCYPWITKMFPNAYFIHWARDPRDFGWHLTDNFQRWKMPVPQRFIKKWTDEGIKMNRVKAAISCKYQWDIVQNTPRPKNFLRMRYEDYCTNQGKELANLKDFLNTDLTPVKVRTTSVSRWKSDGEHVDFPFLKSMLKDGLYTS